MEKLDDFEISAGLMDELLSRFFDKEKDDYDMEKCRAFVSEAIVKALAADTVPVSAIHVHNDGDVVTVELEIGKAWHPVVVEQCGEENVVSHIIEYLGIKRAYETKKPLSSTLSGSELRGRRAPEPAKEPPEPRQRKIPLLRAGETVRGKVVNVWSPGRHLVFVIEDATGQKRAVPYSTMFATVLGDVGPIIGATTVEQFEERLDTIVGRDVEVRADSQRTKKDDAFFTIYRWSAL